MNRKINSKILDMLSWPVFAVGQSPYRIDPEQPENPPVEVPEETPEQPEETPPTSVPESEPEEPSSSSEVPENVPEKVETPPRRLIQTGQNEWLVWVLAAAGGSFLLLGIHKRRKGKHEA